VALTWICCAFLNKQQTYVRTTRGTTREAPKLVAFCVRVEIEIEIVFFSGMAKMMDMADFWPEISKCRIDVIFRMISIS